MHSSLEVSEEVSEEALRTGLEVVCAVRSLLLIYPFSPSISENMLHHSSEASLQNNINTFSFSKSLVEEEGR